MVLRPRYVSYFKENALRQIPIAPHVCRVSLEMDTRTFTTQQVIQQGASGLLQGVIS